MSRDHNIGFKPAAQLAAEHADTDGYLWKWSNPYALGVPKRVSAEWAAANPLDEPPRDPKVIAFESGNHALPDGTVLKTAAQLACERRRAEFERVQRSDMRTSLGPTIRAKLEFAWDKAEREGRDPYAAAADAARERVETLGQYVTSAKVSSAVTAMAASLQAQQANPGALGRSICSMLAPPSLLEEVDADMRATLTNDLPIPF